jgi:uncharacterized protein
VGFLTHGAPHVIMEAIRHERDGGFDYVTLHWYWIYQRNAVVIDMAAERDMGVCITSPSETGGRLYDPPEKLVKLCEPWHPAVFNAVFCLNQPEVHTLSTGPARPEELDLTVGALKWVDEQPRDVRVMMDKIAHRLEDARAAVVPPELREPFGRLPEWEVCPGEINMAAVVWLWGLVKAFDMTGYGQTQYNLLGSPGHWLPGRNAAGAEQVDLTHVGHASGIGVEQLRAVLKEAHEMLGKKG